MISFSIIWCSAGGIGAAGAGFEVAVGVEAMVVVRYDFIEIRIGTFAAGVGVVEDHVLHDAQACLVQTFHHGAIFADAIVRVDGVAPSGAM